MAVLAISCEKEPIEEKIRKNLEVRKSMTNEVIATYDLNTLEISSWKADTLWYTDMKIKGHDVELNFRLRCDTYEAVAFNTFAYELEDYHIMSHDLKVNETTYDPDGLMVGVKIYKGKYLINLSFYDTESPHDLFEAMYYGDKQ